MKKIKKLINKMRIKWKNSLLRKIIKLKNRINILEKQLIEYKKQNHDLIDQKTLDNIKIRELLLEVKK